MQDLQLKNEHLDAQIRTINEKIMRSDEQIQHYGSALEEVARQVESSNRYTANQLYNQNLQLQNSAIRGAPQEGPTLSKIINKSELGELRKDFLLLVQEISNDKLDVLREIGNLNTQVKSKIDALAWHARCLNLVTVNQIQEALTLFKRSLLPSDNAQIRNVYIKMMDHRSSAIIHLSALLRTEALQEKMTLTGNKNQSSQEQSELPDNTTVQRRLYQLLSIIEPILLNDENVIKGINSGLPDIFCEMLIFQSQNLQNIQRNIMSLNPDAQQLSMPQYLKVLVRCLTSMLRNEQTVDRILQSNNCRPLMALTKIMKLSREEEVIANSLKIIRYCIKDESVSCQFISH